MTPRLVTAAVVVIAFLAGVASVHFGWPVRYPPPLVQGYEKPTLWPAGLSHGRSGWAVVVEYGDFVRLVRAVEKACQALHQDLALCGPRGYAIDIPEGPDLSKLPKGWPILPGKGERQK